MLSYFCRVRRSKTRKSTFYFTLFFAAVLLASFLVWQHYKNATTRFVRYPAFDIELPENYSLHGIDVSHHQSKINWDEVVKMNVDGVTINFCFIKATEGIESVDNRFTNNWQEAERVGMIKGAYHFFNPSRDGILQANNFIRNVSLKKGDLPPVLDIEHVHGIKTADIQKRIGEWLATVEQHYHVKPIIYTYADFYERNLAGKFDDYPLWVAHYLEKNRPGINRNWLFWQHNESGRVNGISARVDFNVFNGDFFDFKRLLIQ